MKVLGEFGYNCHKEEHDDYGAELKAVKEDLAQNIKYNIKNVFTFTNNGTSRNISQRARWKEMLGPQIYKKKSL